ncbi:hypothetical protein [Sandarakinorhabdus oryzae]|uniref:hypothetical protein n=1 Tax=Sandarakinorhabdus oryzae TaxID=2675220 RepID=UPI0012E1323A|nr:hypothetical protein [Sandarakinorhabdus oryzae]
MIFNFFAKNGKKSVNFRSFRPSRPLDDEGRQILLKAFFEPQSPALRLLANSLVADPVEGVPSWYDPHAHALREALKLERPPAVLAEAALMVQLVLQPGDKVAATAQSSLLKVIEDICASVEAQQLMPSQPIFTADELTDLLWALGSWMESSRWQPKLPKLWRLVARDLAIAPAQLPKRVRQACFELIQRLGEADHLLSWRQAIAARLVAILELSPDHSPTLVARDREFAARAQRREQVMLMAGQPLAEVLTLLLDAAHGAPRDELSIDGPLLAGSHLHGSLIKSDPLIRKFLTLPPAELGQALVALAAIETELLTLPTPDWPWLARPRGVFKADPHVVQPSGPELLRIAILARRITLSDADAARLVDAAIALPLYEHPSLDARKPPTNSYRSQRFVKLMVDIARQPDSTATRAALARIVAKDGAPGWSAAQREEIAAAIGVTADTALAPPQASVFGAFQAENLLLSHFSNILDSRLQSPEHRAYLEGLIAECTPWLPENSLPPRATQAYAPPLRQFIHDMGSLIRKDQAADLVPLATSIIAILDAVQPIVLGQSLSGLGGFAKHCSRLSSTPSMAWRQKANSLVAAWPDDVVPRLLAALLENVPANRPSPGQEVLQALIVMSVERPSPDLAQAIAEYAVRNCLKAKFITKPAAKRLAKTCIWALAHLPAEQGRSGLDWIDANVRSKPARRFLTRATERVLACETHGPEADDRN